jgi:hypothetical protein
LHGDTNDRLSGIVSRAHIRIQVLGLPVGSYSYDRTAGAACIDLPGWFEALNKDFWYQLTCIGGYAPVYIAEKVSGNRFKIAGGVQGLEVSWQVTGVRQDPYAEKHRIRVEEEKPPQERGKYLHPDLYGATESMKIQPESPEAR